MQIERYAHANHAISFGASSRSRLPSGSTVPEMPDLEQIAKMDEGDLASLLRSAVPQMQSASRIALVGSIFDAFRDRGESSEDAAEGANTSVDALESGAEDALLALIAYARHETGLLKEALELFAEAHGDQLNALLS